MTDEVSTYYSDLLDGAYDCVDRIVLNAYNRLCYAAGGFREWWRRLSNGSDEDLDNTHLMRMAGRFSRRLRAFAKASGIPIIDCPQGERKHEIAAEYLLENPDARGLFLILVARAVAPVWDIQRSTNGTIRNIARKNGYINHYYFHIMDPEWGHITIKMSGHPPFGAQVILNGHEYVACQSRKTGVSFTKEGNCFTGSSNAADLARVADTLSDPRTIGRLTQVCERWLYSSCLCFALDSEEQERTRFHYEYSIYQTEYSRNLIFRVGRQMDQVFQGMIDRTRARLDVRQLKTIFGAKARPHRNTKRNKAPRLEVVVEKPTYDLTVFKLHFGKLTLKAYTKGECVLRFEAIVHNVKDLNCGRVMAKFPYIVSRLKGMLDRFMDTLYCVDVSFIADATLDQLPLPSRVGKTRIGGVDPNQVRMRTVLAAVLALVPSPKGFCVAELAAKVQEISGQTEADYGARRAAYDLKKLRGKNLIAKLGSSHHYEARPEGIRTIAALLILRDQVIKPLLAGVATRKDGRKPKNQSSIDQHYQTLRTDMQNLFKELRIAA